MYANENILFLSRKGINHSSDHLLKIQFCYKMAMARIDIKELLQCTPFVSVLAKKDTNDAKKLLMVCRGLGVRYGLILLVHVLALRGFSPGGTLFSPLLKNHLEIRI